MVIGSREMVMVLENRNHIESFQFLNILSLLIWKNRTSTWKSNRPDEFNWVTSISYVINHLQNVREGHVSIKNTPIILTVVPITE